MYVFLLDKVLTDFRWYKQEHKSKSKTTDLYKVI